MGSEDKRLKKALSSFEAGNYDESLSLCEKILEKDYSNEEALALEGKILYLQGNIEEGKVTWRINADYNNNEEAKKYLEEVDTLLLHKEKFNEAISYIDKKDYKQALDKLSECKHRSFNKINIDNALEKCSKRKSKNAKTSPIVSKVPNKVPEKKLDFSSLGEYRINFSPKVLKISGIAICGVLVISLGVSIFKTMDISSALDTNSPSISDSSNPGTDKVDQTPTPAPETTTPETSQLEEEQPTVEEVVNFPGDEIKDAVANEETTRLYNLLTSVPKDKLSEDQLKIYNKGIKYMQEQGVQTIYDIALDKFNAKDYEGAVSSFKKALTFADGNYLDPHIIYMLGTVNEKVSMDEAFKYYQMYLDKFPTGEYASQILYRFVILNKDANPEAAKKAAEDIANKFSDSMYYNDIVKEVLNK